MQSFKSKLITVEELCCRRNLSWLRRLLVYDLRGYDPFYFTRQFVVFVVKKFSYMPSYTMSNPIQLVHDFNKIERLEPAALHAGAVMASEATGRRALRGTLRVVELDSS
ncbi:hypothetical protein EVAR_41111_1 [Eumeta japonica]|uniref:Uncharacterized protein n=1 Tax=Eumeta variegata TaxID=151549 RepID=A0A4C1XCU3_EUMVA|nr:hypothetical protein EVAR_41111_1 [Eumeta japonica]